MFQIAMRVRVYLMFAVLSGALFVSAQASHAASEVCRTDGLPAISIVPLPLDPADPKRESVGDLRYRGGFWLKNQHPKFGGFSGMWVSPDGTRLVAVSDGGYWMEGTLGYDAAGNLSTLAVQCFGELLDETGKVSEWWEDRDSEALTFDGKNFLVGFEENLRILAYEKISGNGRDIPLPSDFASDVPPWGGYSSIASKRPGSFVLLTEYARNDQKDTKGYIRSGGESGVFWLAARGDQNHLPVDLAVLPDGDFLVAEIARIKVNGQRKFFRFRLSRIAAADLRPGNRVVPKTLAEMAWPMIGEKYEALASRQDENGKTLIYLMSDSDNRRAERTVIRMFELVEK